MNQTYDNEIFFSQYARMPRSREGLKAAGEWHQLKPLFPALEGKCVLDLGCGYGWHCRFCEEHGAARILGIDSSRRMIEEARRRGGGNGVSYRVCGVEEYEFPEKAWDLVVSNLVLHYIQDLDSVFERVWNTLREGGIFLFNVEHPVFTAGVGQDWIYAEDGEPKFWPVDDYFVPGKRSTLFLGCQVEKYHHTLTQILGGLLRQGFILEAVEEAQPPEEMRQIPGMEQEMRRPMMLLVRARKGSRAE
ncbi:MAG: class I SAM-dependent methyltransferase [Hungatella sp.]|nr:class I SAM-dependent methyltransferase [Hungatella sp.]